MPKKLLHDGEIFTLTHHLVSCMIEDKNLDIEEAKKLTIVEFWQYLIPIFNEHETVFLDRDEIMETYDVEEQHFQTFELLLANPFAFCNMMLTWWPKLVIRERPPKYKINGICLTLAIQYEPHEEGADPRAFQLPMPLFHPQNTDIPFNTAGTIALWRTQLNQVFDMIIRDGGTDGIYEKFCMTQAHGETTDADFVPARPGGLGF